MVGSNVSRVMRVVGPAPVVELPSADGPEGKLFRAMQKVIQAYSADDLPTPRERVALRAAMHHAVDAYLEGKLAERASAGAGRGSTT